MTNADFSFPIKYKKDCGFLACNEILKTQKQKKSLPKFAILGLPFDNAVTNRKGAKHGPEAIRRASLMLCDAYHPSIFPNKAKQKNNISPLFPHTNIIDYGDIKIPKNIAKMQETVKNAVGKIINQQHLCAIGGDHSLTLPILQAHYQKRGYKPISLIHFDAHCDTWDNHYGEPSGHGTWVYQAHQQGLIDIKKTVQIGIRSSGEAKDINYVANKGGMIITAKELRGLDGAALTPMIKKINNLIANSEVYLSIDIDCLDPAFAPGTGTPEPGGLTITQLISFIEELRNLSFVGMDLVEVNPAYDHAELTTHSAAYIIWSYLCGGMSCEL